jgi:hypothetical protein
MSEVAVQGCSLKISSTAGDISAVSVEPSNSPSTVNLVGTNGIFFDKITALITNATIKATVPSTTNEGKLASGSIDIAGTASNILDSNNKKAVQKGDKATKTLTFIFTSTSSPAEVPTPIPVTVEVDDAGQTDVIAS